MGAIESASGEMHEGDQEFRRRWMARCRGKEAVAPGHAADHRQGHLRWSSKHGVIQGKYAESRATSVEPSEALLHHLKLSLRDHVQAYAWVGCVSVVHGTGTLPYLLCPSYAFFT